MHERTRNGSRESRPVLSTLVAAMTVALMLGTTAAAAAAQSPSGGTVQTPSGKVAVRKVVVNTLGVPTPPAFNMVVHCSANAAAQGSNTPVAVPGGQTVTLAPAILHGITCSVTETVPPPISKVEACKGGGASWTVSYSAPVTIAARETSLLTVTNTLTCDKPAGTTGSLKVIKSVSNMTNGSVTLPTSYPMSVTCTPSGPSSQSIMVPPGSAGTTVGNIAANSQCVVTEAQLPPITNVKACNGGTASWTTMGSPSAAVTIPSGGTATVTVRNTLRCDPPTVSECPNPAQTVIGCRITITVKRTKGPLVYSVIVSPPAPLPNVVAPSTSSSCVIGAGAMINQTTCWFNYSTNPTAVTLTATSSAGALPAGFSWSGACTGSSPTCVLSASPIQKIVTANYP